MESRIPMLLIQLGTGVIGVLERTTTLAGDTKFLRVVLKFLNKRLRYNQKEFF